MLENAADGEREARESGIMPWNSELIWHNDELDIHFRNHYLLKTRYFGALSSIQTIFTKLTKKPAFA
jgi:hypothetical protein